MLKMCKCYQEVEIQPLHREGAVAQYIAGMTWDMLRKARWTPCKIWH